MMVIWNLGHLLMIDLLSMHVTVALMIVDTQEIFAVGKAAFSAISRGF